MGVTARLATVRLGRASLMGVGLVVGLLLGGGVGVAVASSPVLHACITPRSDVLVYSSNGKCAKGAKGIAWNAEGPAGPEGPTGPQGPAGASGGSGGPAGISFYEGTAGPGGVQGTGQVATLTVPAGGYIVSYGITVSANSTASGTCALSTGTNGAFVTFTAPTTITLTCASVGTGLGSFGWDGAAIVAELATQLH